MLVCYSDAPLEDGMLLGPDLEAPCPRARVRLVGWVGAGLVFNSPDARGSWHNYEVVVEEGEVGHDDVDTMFPNKVWGWYHGLCHAVCLCVMLCACVPVRQGVGLVSWLHGLCHAVSLCVILCACVPVHQGVGLVACMGCVML